MAETLRPRSVGPPIPADCDMIDPDDTSDAAATVYPTSMTELPAFVPSTDSVTETPAIPVSSTNPPVEPALSPSPLPPSSDVTASTRPTSSASPLSLLPAAQERLPRSALPQPGRMQTQMPDVSDPLPVLPLPSRQNSSYSRRSGGSEDVDMDESDTELAHGAGDDPPASSDESLTDHVLRASAAARKKRSQRFYCTEYPPCTLSFTRSEHLARHIRKHTGERPFQCHCSRRFSRLDNLRQHAHSVHVNEEIPVDSLAALSRYPRQNRNERIRLSSGRPRPSGLAPAPGPGSGRGHSKSLSTSSLASVSSVGSVYSAAVGETGRRRPPSLVMLVDPHAHSSLDSYRNSADSDVSAPPSATFSKAGHGSPRWGSGLTSPAPSHSRTQSMYIRGSPEPARRLSIPSSEKALCLPPTAGDQAVVGPGSVTDVVLGSMPNSYFSLHRVTRPAAPGPAIGVLPYRSPFASVAANNSTYTGTGSLSGPGGLLPVSPNGGSGWPGHYGRSGRPDMVSSSVGEVWRRRTWHPGTRNDNGGHLVTTVNENDIMATQLHRNIYLPPPLATRNIANSRSSIRLPGIESFYPLLRHPPSPMMLDSDTPSRLNGQVEGSSHSSVMPSHQHAIPTVLCAPAPALGDPAGQWAARLDRGLTQLETVADAAAAVSGSDSAGAWAVDATMSVQSPETHVSLGHDPGFGFDKEGRSLIVLPGNGPDYSDYAEPALDRLSTGRMSKRHGWYDGPGSISTDGHDSAPVPLVESRNQVAQDQAGWQQSVRSVHGSQAHLSPRWITERSPLDARMSSIDRMIHPNIMSMFDDLRARSPNRTDSQPIVGGSQEPESVAALTEIPPSHSGSSLGRFEALVAVATSQGSSANAY